MNKDQVKQAVISGNLIDCTQEEYQNCVRRYLQEFAGESIDSNQTIYAMIALNEVKRLDEKYEAAQPRVKRTGYVASTSVGEKCFGCNEYDCRCADYAASSLR